MRWMWKMGIINKLNFNKHVKNLESKQTEWNKVLSSDWTNDCKGDYIYIILLTEKGLKQKRIAPFHPTYTAACLQYTTWKHLCQEYRCVTNWPFLIIDQISIQVHKITTAIHKIWSVIHLSSKELRTTHRQEVYIDLHDVVIASGSN